MTEQQLQVPLDGLFLSPTPPWGASVLVLRGEDRVLLLHRRGEWSPPALTRLPDEPVERCAARALRELTGLELPVAPMTEIDPQWPVFVARTDEDLLIRLGAGCDAFEWVDLLEAQSRCTDLVSQTLRSVA